MARAAAVLLGLIMVALAVVVLAAQGHGGNPGRAARGLAFVAAIGGVLVWWGLSGRGL